MLDVGPSVWPENRKFVEDKIKMFGTGPYPVWILTDSFKDLLGKPVPQSDSIGNKNIVAELFEEQRFSHVDPQSSFLPALIMAQLHLREPARGNNEIGIAVNGIMQAVTSTIPCEPDLQIVGAVVPENAFRAGANEIQLFLLKDAQTIELLEKTSE